MNFTFTALLAVLFSSLSAQATTQLTFRIDQPTDRGQIILAVYADFAQFDDDQSLHEQRVAVSGSREIVAQLPQLPAGTYGIAAFFDEDSDDKLDTNLFGIPTEPYGFAQEPASKWRKPRWSEISTQLGHETRELIIPLRTWKNR